MASTWRESLLWREPTILGNHPTVGSVNRLIDKFLDEPSVRISIAAEPTRPDRILGWMAYSPAMTTAVIHYVYTREKQRMRGVANQLFDYAWPTRPGKIVYTLKGPSVKWLVDKHPDSVFLPADEYLRS